MKSSWLKKNELRLRRTQGCLTDCVAYLLNIHPENVPFFVYPRKGWNERLKDFLRKNGYEAHWDFVGKIPKRGKHIVVRDSKKWKTYGHCVVYQNGKLAYDPNYPSDWKKDRATHRLFLRKLPT